MPTPSFQFYPGDWLKDPCLRKCTPATKGIYMDLLCLMHLSEERGSLAGTVEQLARMTGCLPSEMDAAAQELSVTKTLRVTFSNGEVTLENRRMLREEEQRINNALRQQRYRERQQGDAKVTVRSSSSSSSSSSKQEREAHTARRGARLAATTIEEIPEEWAQWVEGRYGNGVDTARWLNDEAERFIDYWQAQPGQRGVKLDWAATWRNWFRRAAEQRETQGRRR